MLAVPADLTRAQPDRGVPSRDGLVVCTSAPACDAGAAVLARGGNAVDAAVATAFALAVTHPSAGNIGGGGFMIVRTPAGEVTAFDFREKAPLKSTPTMYLGADGNIDGVAHPRRLPRPRSARQRTRARGCAQEVREAAVARRRHARRHAGGAGLHRVIGARAQPQRRTGADGQIPGLGRRLRQARRRRVGGWRPAGARRSGQDAARHRDGRRRRLLHGLDRGPHRRRHEGERRPDHEGGPRRLPAKGPHAHQGRLQGVRDHLDAAAKLWRRRRWSRCSTSSSRWISSRRGCSPRPRFMPRSKRCAARTSIARGTSAIPTSPRSRSIA